MAQTIGRNCRFLQGPDTDKLEVRTHRIVMMYSNDEDGSDDNVWLVMMRMWLMMLVMIFTIDVIFSLVYLYSFI